MKRRMLPPAVRGLLAVVTLLPRVDRRLAGFLAAGVILTASAPVVVALVTGTLVGSIPAAVGADGGLLGSAAGRTALTLLAAIGALMLVERVTLPLLRAAAEVMGREVDRFLQERVMVAVGRPAGIAHLEDADVLARLRIIRGLGITDASRPSWAVQALAYVLPPWLRALGSAAILFWFAWWLGLLWMVVWPLTVFVMQREYVRVGNVVYGQSDALREAEYLRDLAITAPAAKEIRIWGMLDWLLARFKAAWQAAIEPVWRARRPRLLVLFGTSGVVIAVNLLSFTVLLFAAVRGDLGLAALAVYVQALRGANDYMAFDDQVAHLSFAAASVPKLLDLDKELAASDGAERAEHAERAELSEQRCTVLDPSGPLARIEFAGVRMRYPGTDTEVLHGLDLTIPARRSLAIVGANGAGKTSLVKLLCALYQPTAGRITIDGMSLGDIEPAHWRSRVAVLFQDFARYELTVRDNIGFGAPDLVGDDERLRAAAERAGALELIESLPAGWDTVLSSAYTGGTDLSGGQWQRIALARAMFAVSAGARVLVLDEPTAALDVRAEAALYERFLELTEGLTTILISHRFSTVRRADRIVVLSGGVVVEEGDHDELLAQGGRYAEMFTLQAARFTTGTARVDRGAGVEGEGGTHHG